jgi:signal transduction histidine kinase
VAQELRDRFSIEVTVDVQLEDEPPPGTRNEIARVVREAITNAARHGSATHVIVTLTRTKARTMLRIRDDGCGMRIAPSASTFEGFGLRNMRDRARVLGGSLAVRSAMDRGTEVEVIFD